MDITITGQGVDVTPAIRSYVENKMRKIPRIIQGVMDVHVTINVQKHLHVVDMKVNTRDGAFASHESTSDMYASINGGIDNLLKQMRRARKKSISKKGQRHMELDDLQFEPGNPEEQEDEEVQILREEMPVKPMSLEEARLQLRGADNPFLLFRNATTSELCLLYRRDDGNLGLIETNQ